MEFKKIGVLSDLEPHGQFSRWLDDHDVLVYRLDGKIRALSNICTHFGGPVGYHKMKDGCFTCLWHNFKFSAKDGACLSPGGLSLREYTIKVEGDAIMVQLVERASA
ncbi:MAG: Rieske (2Fe-2S) protein [Elusimicrobia bacterium]|nr:Rieske (2Fe-2S) protein [Elusimicrobiota bacterium]